MFRGEVWQMSISRTPAEKAALTRPVVIVSSDSLNTLPLRVVVPLTPWRSDYSSAPWMVRIPPVLNSGLETAMSADALQVRSVSNARLVKRLGELPNHLVNAVADAVGLILEQRADRV